MRVWLSAAEIAQLALPELPTTKRNVNAFASRAGWTLARNARGEPLTRPRAGRGGGLEYHIDLLPAAARAAYDAREAQRSPLSAMPGREEAWAAYERLPERHKAIAQQRAAILARIDAVCDAGAPRGEAIMHVRQDLAREGQAVTQATVYNWFAAVAAVDPADRLPALAPRYTGGAARVEADPELVALFAADYLRPEKPAAQACYRRVAAIAKAEGKAIPPIGVLIRRMDASVSETTRLLLREGEEALARSWPHLTRDRTALAALDLVVGDTHTWDVMVEWPDGSTCRPAMTAISDAFSNKLLAWRVAQTESADVVRLAFGDVFRTYGLPSAALLDNGRAFASKAITGGQANRYRFKVRAEDPTGVLTGFGIRVHWSKPYSGQSKPIERSFRDLAGDVAKHPAFAGAYTGPHTAAKPANYGARAIPLADFLAVVRTEIAAWNARPGRRTPVCGGTLSFDQAFEASYAVAPIRKPTAEQLRLCLLAAEQITPDRRSGAVTLFGNRYWSEALAAHRNDRLIIRFDPDDLRQAVHVYALDGRYLCAADLHEQAGFLDTDAARRHERARRDYVKARKKLAAAEVAIDSATLAARQIVVDDTPATPASDPAVVRPAFGARMPGAPVASDTPAETTEPTDFMERLMRAQRRAAIA